MSGYPTNRVYLFGRWLTRIAVRLLGGCTVRGAEHVPASGACLIAANHASYFDPPVLGAAVGNRLVRFMARDSLFGIVGLGWLLRRIEVVPLRRGQAAVAALRTALRILREGGAVGLFPEGTRTRDGRLQPARGGVGFLVAKAAVPVVPAYIDGTFHALPRGRRWPRRGPLSVTFGPPIRPDEIALRGRGQEAYEQLGALVMERIGLLRDREDAAAFADAPGTETQASAPR